MGQEFSHQFKKKSPMGNLDQGFSRRYQECSEREGIGLASSVETLGGDLRTRTKQLGAKEKAGRNRCNVRFSIARKESCLSEELHQNWCEEACGGWACSLREGGEDRQLAFRPQTGCEV